MRELDPAGRQTHHFDDQCEGGMKVSFSPADDGQRVHLAIVTYARKSPKITENFQATDRSISHARRYRFPKIATGNRTILVSLSMFCAGHRWYM